MCGYKASDAESPSTDIIYDGKSFYPVYMNDIQKAQREILIVSLYAKTQDCALTTSTLPEC